MRNSARPGWLRLTWTQLGRALRRGLLGKSSHEYMKQFSGSDDYWDEAIAAQRGWPQARSAATHQVDQQKCKPGEPLPLSATPATAASPT